MTHFLAVEACATEFKNEGDIMAWIRTSKFAELLEVKGVKFRRNNQAKYLTREKKRAVWRWDVKGIASWTSTEWIRPTPFVIVAVRAGTLVPQSEYPEKLKQTIEFEEAKRKRHMDKVAELRLKRIEAAKNKPPKVKKPREKRKAPEEVTKPRKESKKVEIPEKQIKKEEESTSLLEEMGLPDSGP